MTQMLSYLSGDLSYACHINDTVLIDLSNNAVKIL
jgi:hypothetical protein